MLLRLCRSFTATVTKDKLKLSFSRSQGSGVQSVNKINSKADGRFHIDSADWITPEAKSRLKQIFAHHINKEGELVVQSQKFRDQKSNEDAVIEKMQEMINKAYEAPIIQNQEESKDPEAINKKRILAKRARSERRSLECERYEDDERKYS